MKSMMIEKRSADVKVINPYYSNDRKNANQKRIEKDEEELQELLKKYDMEEEPTKGEPQEDTVESEEEHSEAVEENSNEGDTGEETPEPESKEEKTWAKRYGDLRRHAAETEKKLKAQIEELSKNSSKGMPQKPLATKADVEKWIKDNPKVGSIIQALAEDIAQKQLGSVSEEFKQIKAEKEALKIAKAENKIKSVFPDFETLRDSDEFHEWAESKPKWIQDALYENPDDPDGVIEVIKLYKTDKGVKSGRGEPLGSVKGRGGTPSSNSKKRIWRTSEIKAMTPREYEKYEADIDAAMAEGRVEDDLRRR